MKVHERSSTVRFVKESSFESFIELNLFNESIDLIQKMNDLFTNLTDLVFEYNSMAH